MKIRNNLVIILVFILSLILVAPLYGCVSDDAKEKGKNNSAVSLYERLSGVWVNKPADTEEEFFPSITLKSDKTFKLTVNLLEGMGNAEGVYSVKSGKIHCIIKAKDFSGFVGDEQPEYIFKIDGDRLIYESDMIGITNKGDVFKHKE
ncbi:MAG: hypothetical protein J5659_03680 [Clostridia bacterium]|nr:hypothetical protein [Clostridia bacterium]